MKKHRLMSFVRRTWRQWRTTVLVVVFVLVPIKSSLADWNWVPTGSMNPTIVEGDLVYVNKIAYDLRLPLTLHRLAKWADPKRGDIVVCFSPEDRTRLVKRVIGVPGDTIELRNNTLHLNGGPVPYTPADSRYAACLPRRWKGECLLATEDLDGAAHAVMSIPSIEARRSFGPVTVPPGTYFLMGDNRDLSKDSRFFGFVDRKLIVGRARGVIGSLDITDKYQPRLKRFFSPLK